MPPSVLSALDTRRCSVGSSQVAVSCFLIGMRGESLRSWLGLLKDTLKHFHTLDSSWDFEQPQIGSGQESERRELRWLPALAARGPGQALCSVRLQPPGLRIGAVAASLTLTVVDPSQNQTGVSAVTSAFMPDVSLTFLLLVALLETLIDSRSVPCRVLQTFCSVCICVHVCSCSPNLETCIQTHFFILFFFNVEGD